MQVSLVLQGWLTPPQTFLDSWNRSRMKVCTSCLFATLTIDNNSAHTRRKKRGCSRAECTIVCSTRLRASIMEVSEASQHAVFLLRFPRCQVGLRLYLMRTRQNIAIWGRLKGAKLKGLINWLACLVCVLPAERRAETSVLCRHSLRWDGAGWWMRVRPRGEGTKWYVRLHIYS